MAGGGVELQKACNKVHAHMMDVMPHLLSLSYTSGTNFDFSLKLSSPNSDIFISYYSLPYSTLDPTLTKEGQYPTSILFLHKFLVTLQQCVGGFVFLFI